MSNTAQCVSYTWTARSLLLIERAQTHNSNGNVRARSNLRSRFQIEFVLAPVTCMKGTSPLSPSELNPCYLSARALNSSAWFPALCVGHRQSRHHAHAIAIPSCTTCIQVTLSPIPLAPFGSFLRSLSPTPRSIHHLLGQLALLSHLSQQLMLMLEL